jgi:alpha-ketoglutarate-dependent taurine dioxygenase
MHMPKLDVKDLSPALGAEVAGFDPNAPMDEETRQFLRHLFDTRYLLRFRDIEISHAQQFMLSMMLIGQEGPDLVVPPDTFYVSNRKSNKVAPYGRLQFHSDAMWAQRPFEVLSLYGLEVEQPSPPTIFVSAVEALKTLPNDLRRRGEGRDALHTAGPIHRRNMADVLKNDMPDPPTAVHELFLPHKRTGERILYASEQVTREIVGMPPDESEDLLNDLFDHLYQPAHQWENDWQQGDLVVWDDFAIQHGRKNVILDGPSRTLRKVAHPIPQLTDAQKPVFALAQS